MEKQVEDVQARSSLNTDGNTDSKQNKNNLEH